MKRRSIASLGAALTILAFGAACSSDDSARTAASAGGVGSSTSASAPASTPASTDPSAAASATPNPSAASASPMVLNPKLGVATGDTDAALIKSKATDAYLQDVANLGAGAVRFDAQWSAGQKSQNGTMSFGVYDPIMAKMTALGIKPQPILGSTPKWAATSGCKLDYYACPPANINEAAKFAGEFAAKYGAQVDQYEMTDSPDGRIPEQRYVELLQLTAEKIRASDAGAKIILSLDPNAKLLTTLYKLGAKSAFDGINVQVLTSPASASVVKSEIPKRVKAMHQVMAKNGDSGKLIQLTVGIPTGGQPSVTQAQQGPLIATALTAAQSLKTSGVNLGPVFIYNGRDLPTGKPHDPWSYMGLSAQNGTHKPAWTSVQKWAANNM